MLWFAFALTSALAMSASDALSKHLNRRVSDFTNVLVRFLYAAPFLMIPVIHIPTLDRSFWLPLTSLLPLEIAVWLLYLKAIRLCPWASPTTVPSPGGI